MGLGEAAALGGLFLGYRVTEKVARRVLDEYPLRFCRFLVEDADNESELEGLLIKGDGFARMVRATHDGAKYGLSSAEASESLAYVREELQFSRVPAEEFDPPHRELLADRECHVMVFRHQTSGKVVVSVRGTVRTSWSDWRENSKICAERLHKSDRVAKIGRLVRFLIKRYGHESVIVTGHSLGAAITFMIARELYLEGKEVEGHFFALPFVSLDKIIEKIQTFSMFPIAAVKDAFSLNRVVEDRLGTLKEGFARLRSDFEVDEAREEFLRLVGWHPHIYVHEFDAVSNGYIEYFNNTSPSADGLGMSLISMINLDSKARHLCPSAILITGKAGVETLSSHGINRWIGVEPLRFKGVKFTNLCPVKEYERL